MSHFPSVPLTKQEMNTDDLTLILVGAGLLALFSPFGISWGHGKFLGITLNVVQ